MDKSPTIKQLLDVNYVKKHTEKKGELKVSLRKNKKGGGLYAATDIKKGSVIAYYKMTVYNSSKHKSPTKNRYTFTVYTPTRKESKTLIGDLSPESLPRPIRNIPYWAYFSNEPSPGEEENAYIDVNIEGNYRNRSRLSAGETMVYKLRAAKNIKKGQEILWCYGDYYNRNYTTSCLL